MMITVAAKQERLQNILETTVKTAIVIVNYAIRESSWCMFHLGYGAIEFQVLNRTLRKEKMELVLII